jgi:hypothetical protein
VKLGPLQKEPGSQTGEAVTADRGSWPLERLVDRFAVKPIDHSQMLCVVVCDHDAPWGS